MWPPSQKKASIFQGSERNNAYRLGAARFFPLVTDHNGRNFVFAEMTLLHPSQEASLLQHLGSLQHREVLQTEINKMNFCLI